MENKLKINLTKEFKDYLNSLNINKKAIISSKLSFLENTGFLGGCKTLGNNIFEYRIDSIKDKIYYFINNNEITLFNDLTLKNNLENISKTSLLEYNKEALKNTKYAKSFYDEIYILYKQTNEEKFFLNELKNILEVQSQDNFKKITNFDSNYITNSQNNVTTLNQLKDKINFVIKLKSIGYI